LRPVFAVGGRPIQSSEAVENAGVRAFGAPQDQGSAMYGPAIMSADALRTYDLGSYRATLLGNIVAAGSIQYGYVLTVRRKADDSIVLHVATEENALAGMIGGGRFFLCMFESGQHLNFGSSDDWADCDLFAARALELVAEHTGASISSVADASATSTALPPELTALLRRTTH
jgi:hypothetical protein